MICSRRHTRRAGIESVVFVIAAAITASCGEAPAQEPALAVDTTGVRVVFSDPLRSDTRCSLGTEPVLSIGASQGEAPYGFEGVRGVARLSDGSVAVMNNGTGQIRIFGADGRYLRGMGRTGRGPGEFNTGFSIWVLPGDTLWVGDYRPWRFNVFQASGAFVRAVEVTPDMDDPDGGGVLANGVSVNVDDGRARLDFEHPEPRHVYAHFRDGSRVRRLATLNGPRYGEWRGAAAALPTLFDPVPRVDARGTTIAITTSIDPEVLVLDESLRPRHIVRWSDPEREVTSAHVQAFRDIFIESAGGRESETWSRFHEDAVSDQRPVANLFPTVSSLKVGRDGRLWVARYRRPGERWAWMVFGPEGDFICWCPQLPVAPYEFGGDYVLGTRTDDQGVERVLMYEWHPTRRPHRSKGRGIMNGRFALSTAFLTALSGCAEEVREPGSFFGDGCILDTEAAPCDDCIEFAHVTRLGSDEMGPGFLFDRGTMENVVRDRLGNYWVGQNEEIKVFDPDGAFLRTVGRRGDGPMEFGRAAPMHADASGRVHVFDRVNLRISLIDEAFTLVEEKRLPTRVSAEAPLDDGDRYVVQASIEGPGREGMTLHIIDGTGVLKSFGAGEEEPDEGFSLGSIDLRLAGGPEGRVFAAQAIEYMIEAWSPEGTRVGALRGEPQLNTEASLQEPPSPESPLPSGIGDIHADSGGLLWVYLLILRPDWLQHIVWDPSGDVSSEFTPDVITRIYQPRLDVIDLAACTLVASQLHDQMLVLLDDRTALGYGFTELGANTLDVLRMRLTR